MSIATIALLGADGKLGSAVLQALIKQGFSVTVLKRASSKSSDTYPAGVHVAKVQDEFEVDAVAEHLYSIDAVVVTIKGSQTDIQYRIAQACVKAGVHRFIPADFGSCDSSSSRTQDLVPLYKRKTELRDMLTELAENNPWFSWTSLVCGHFLDWSLEFLHLSVKERKAEILDDGEVKWSASTLFRTAEATARILQNLESTKNKMIYVQSVCISQNQAVKAYEQATGASWDVTKYDSKEYEREEKRKADSGDLEAVENLVWLLGTLDGNWEGQNDFAMKSLGLENESLEAIVKRVVEEHS